MNRQLPGKIRDAIIATLEASGRPATLQEIEEGVADRLGRVPSSSVRSYLRLNVEGMFERVDRGLYQLAEERELFEFEPAAAQAARQVDAQLVQGDCLEWLRSRSANSIEAVVTDPPYGLVEYSELEQGKMRNGKGGIWRIPPSFDGHKRAPLPRFTVLSAAQLKDLHSFFERWAKALLPVLVPGANVVVASNPLLSHIVSNALAAAGLERRGEIVRLVMTMRGGDRPKNAHAEFSGVTVMPRSMW